MLSQRILEEIAHDAGLPASPVFLEETGSTSTDALRMAEDGASEWTLVAANHQTEGRGRLGRSWTSAPGKLLQISLILRPEGEPAAAPVLSLVAAAEMASACEEVAGVEVGCKWPNDLVAGGRKLGGILPEARLEGGRIAHVILGIGVNVAMHEEDFPPELRGSATSLAIEGGRAKPEAVLAAFLRGFRARSSAGLDPYRARCITLGRRVRAQTTGGETVDGTAMEIDPYGGLIVQTNGERRTVAFGEVAHLD